MSCDQNNPNRDLSDPTWESENCYTSRKKKERRRIKI
jgi:hypothetical protein